MNKVVLIGNLVRDPELAYSKSGKAYCKFTLAVSDKFQKDKTDFIDCIAWNKTAELIAEYSKKGHKLGISGSITTNTYENKEGKKVKTFAIKVEDMDFLTPKTNAQPKDDWEGLGREVDNGDELPF